MRVRLLLHFTAFSESQIKFKFDNVVEERTSKYFFTYILKENGILISLQIQIRFN